MTYNNNQKGFSVYLTIVIMGVLLAVSLGLVNIIVGGAKIASNLSGSVIAFHAADTGIEKALYSIRKNDDCAGSSASGDFGSSNYIYTVVISYTGGSCSETGTTIESLGQYDDTKRKVEASY